MLKYVMVTLGQEDAPPLPPARTGGEAPTATTQQPGGSAGPGAGDGAPPPGAPGSQFLLIILAAMVVMIIFSMGGQRKEKKKRAAMLAGLKKGDRVQTVGGVLGTAVEVRDHDVIVKVDENANTRIHFARSAIQSVTKEDEG